MPILTIPPNVTPGGQIQSNDVLTLYNAINNGLDGTNIASGSLTGTVFAAGSISSTKLKSANTAAGVQQPAAKHFGGGYITIPSQTMFFPALATDSGVATIGSLGGWRLAGTATTGVIGGGAGTLTMGGAGAIGDASTDFNMAGGIGAGGADGSIGCGWNRVAANITPQFVIWLAVLNATNVATNQAFVSGNYLQASPPYDLGDGEIPMFVYALVGKDGHVCMTFVSPDPPWLLAPQQKLKLPVSHEEALADPSKMPAYLDALDASVDARKGLMGTMTRFLREGDPVVQGNLKKAILAIGSQIWETPPETQDYKNRNMAKMPHPFVANDLVNGGAYETSAPLTPVLLDPVDKNTHRLAMLHESGENVNALLHNKHVVLGNTHLSNRKGPPGVMIVSHSFKNSGGR